ncbi:MAG: hypothetical protein KAS38_18725 [Anaerolineales bacterium]|nr:hypothetical protein [Anaerolineales bacterium]
MTPQQFEQESGLKPFQAADALGLSRRTYFALKAGTRKLQPYQIKAMEYYLEAKKALETQGKDT